MTAQMADNDNSGVLASKPAMVGVEEAGRQETLDEMHHQALEYEKPQDLTEMIESLATVPLDVLFGVDASLCTWWAAPSNNDGAIPVDKGDAEVDALLLRAGTIGGGGKESRISKSDMNRKVSMDFTSTDMTDDDRGSTTVAVLPSIGSMVRVTTSFEPLQRCRATVMTVDDNKQSDKGPTFDLLIEEDVETELSEVKLEKIAPLETFELDGSINAPPPQDLEGAITHARGLKDMGNYLFRLADYGAAAGVYETLLEWLTAVDDASPVADVHCAAYLNVARCLLKTSKNEDAVKACTSGAQQGKKYLLRLKEQPGGEKAFPELSQTLRRHCHSAFSLRCQAYLRQNFFREALADVQCMRQTALTDMHILEVDRMAALIEKQRDKHQRGNRHLVKEVSKWVDTCMAKQSNVVQSMDVED